MKLYKTIILAAAALFAVSCSNDPETELELTAENIQVSSVGGTQTFNINCNADWTISVPAAADWLTVNPTSGSKSATITVTIQPYEDATGRSTTLTVTSENLVRSLSIVQTRPEVPADPAEQVVNVRAGAKELTIDAPQGYVYKVSAPKDGFITVGDCTKESIVLTVAENATGKDREAEVLILTTDDKELAQVTVKQGWRYVNPGDVLIEEVFFTGTLNETNSTAVGEQYIKFTNNSDETLYMDGLIFAAENFFYSQMTSVGSYWAHPELEDAICIENAYRFPGNGTEHPVEAGKSIILALAAQNYSADNANAIDLSGADFEIYEENDRYPDIDNPDVPNVDVLFKRSQSLTSLHNRGYESYALFALPPAMTLEAFEAEYKYDVTITFWMNGAPLTTSQLLSRTPTAYRIPNEWVVDGVNCGVSQYFNAPQFNSSIDAGYTGCGTVDNDQTRFGKSTIRKKDAKGKLVDTNNSTNDFTGDSTPSLKK